VPFGIFSKKADLAPFLHKTADFIFCRSIMIKNIFKTADFVGLFLRT